MRETAPGIAPGGYPSSQLELDPVKIPKDDFQQASPKDHAAKDSEACCATAPVSIPRPPTTSEKVRKIIAATEPTFLNITVNRIHAQVPIKNKEVLEALVRTIFGMVTGDTIDDLELDHSKHARCGETYADVMFSLRGVVPKFEMANDKPMTFTRILLNVTQDTFEAMCSKFADAENAKDVNADMSNSLLALVSFIGHLFVRRLVAARVVAQVVHDLVGVKDRQPDQRLIRCVCELMQVIGKSIDATKQGNMLMTQFLARLTTLSSSTTSHMYPQEIRDAINAVHEARSQHWPAREGTQVLVQYHIVTAAEALKIWDDLKMRQALPVELMHSSRPHDMSEEKGQHIKITAVISGNPLAVLFSQSEESLKEIPLKEKISELSSIHAQRLMVFTPSSALLEDARHSVLTQAGS